MRLCDRPHHDHRRHRRPLLNVAGIPTYGIPGMFSDAEGSHAHGLDERIRVRSLLDGRRFLYALVKRYADAP